MINNKHFLSKTIAVTLLAALPLCAAIKPAQAQYFSNHDGYTDDGQYRIQAELAPYLWIPATSGSIGFAKADIASRNFSTPVPSISNLAQTLHFSFMGAGILRYGPYSAEVDLQYVNGSQSKTLETFPLGRVARVNVSANYLRIAPGFGYQVYSGNIAGIPASADARAGFAYFTSSQSLKGEGVLTGEVKGSDDFIQPWAGIWLDLIPAPQWRLELSGLVQGMGVSGGSWGWGAAAIGSYAFNDLVALDIGFRAIETEREQGHRDTLAAGKRSISLLAYGPLVGISFRLGSSPLPPPAPAPAPVAAPAPAPVKTYLVFFDWDKANLTPRATEVIAEAATQSKSQTTTIAVNGYTDTSGTPTYNQGLSVRRAKAVAAQLVADGVPESEITAQGFGDTSLLVPTGPGVREPQNRRVEIILQ